MMAEHEDAWLAQAQRSAAGRLAVREVERLREINAELLSALEWVDRAADLPTAKSVARAALVKARGARIETPEA